MIPFGTLFNIGAVVLGSIIGLLFQKVISQELNKKVFSVLGMFTLVLGFSMALNSTDFIIMFISIVFGTILGEVINLANLLSFLTEKLKNKIKIKNDRFSDGLITSFLLFCIGSMTIVGAIDEGLGKSPDILYTKSIMDGISAIILSSTFGLGVLFSVFPMFIFQAGITIIVFYYKDFLPTELIDHISAVGGILIISIGFKILGYYKINPTNMLPSLLVVILIYVLKSHI